MYILIENPAKNKEKVKYSIYKDLTEIEKQTNIPIQTIRNNLSKKGFYNKGIYSIIKPDYIQQKSNSGGNRGNLG